MKVIYDRETDSLLITLREAPIRESDEVRPGVIADFGEDGGVVRFEVEGEPAQLTLELRGSHRQLIRPRIGDGVVAEDERAPHDIRPAARVGRRRRAASVVRSAARDLIDGRCRSMSAVQEGTEFGGPRSVREA